MSTIESDMWSVIRSHEKGTQELKALTNKPILEDLERIKQDSLDTLEKSKQLTPPGNPSRIHWLSLLLGACLGAAVLGAVAGLAGGVAIAGWILL